MELALLRRGGSGLVPQLPLLHQVREGGFFDGTSLHPLPPGESKDDNVGYLNIHEDDPFDEAQFAEWVKQASESPGWASP